jgi:hypothetical protein
MNAPAGRPECQGEVRSAYVEMPQLRKQLNEERTPRLNVTQQDFDLDIARQACASHRTTLLELVELQ